MAQINLKIKSDFAQASKDLKNFGTITEAERKRIEKYRDAFQTEKVDKFIDANRRLGAGVKANKGDISAIIVQQKALEKQSINLIKNGLDPQSEEVEKLSDEYNRLQKEYEDTTKASEDTEEGFRLTKVQMIALGVVAVKLAGELKDIAVESINAASDAQETQNKFDVVFSGISNSANQMAEDLAVAYGTSVQGAKDMLAGTGDLLTGLGFTQQSAFDLSEQVLTLGSDLASFTNYSGGAEGASEALTKALLGEREMLKGLGISINEADVKAEMLKQTQDGLTFETEKQAKAQATLTLALSQTANAQGDFARSSQSYANQMKIAKARTADLQVELGRALLPTATQGVGIFGALTGKLGEYLRTINDVRVAEEAQAAGIITREQELTLLDYKLDKINDQFEAEKLLFEAQDEYESETSKFARRQASYLESQITGISRKMDALNEEIKVEGEKEQKIRDTEQAEIDKAEAERQRIEALEIQHQIELDAIQKIQDAKKTDIELIDQQIKDIQSFATLSGDAEKAQLEAIKLLQEEKELIQKAEVQAKKDALAEIQGNEDAFLAESNEKARAAAEEKEAIQLASFQKQIASYAGYSKTIGGIATNLFSAQSNLIAKEEQEQIDALDNKQLSEEEYEDALVEIKKEAALKQWEIDKKTAAANKTLALIEIAANTAIGISKALAQGGVLGIASGVLIGIAGAAAAAQVISTPEPAKPTFQTGTPMGGFEVPQNTGSSRADNTNISVSPNEVVSVAPRGESGGQVQNIIVQIDKQVIYDIVTEGNESGEIRITSDNIQSA